MWIYKQSTGELMRADSFEWLDAPDQQWAATGLERIATGYSGYDEGLNNPDLEGMRNVGPIPRGCYLIGEPRDSDQTGPHVMDLTPWIHDAEDRTAFQMHGDNGSDGGDYSSRGCIVAARWVRERVAQSGDNALVVVK